MSRRTSVFCIILDESGLQKELHSIQSKFFDSSHNPSFPTFSPFATIEERKQMLTFLASAAAANLASRLASLVRLFLSKVSGTAICYKVFLSVSYFYFFLRITLDIETG